MSSPMAQNGKDRQLVFRPRVDSDPSPWLCCWLCQLCQRQQQFWQASNWLESIEASPLSYVRNKEIRDPKISLLNIAMLSRKWILWILVLVCWMRDLPTRASFPLNSLSIEYWGPAGAAAIEYWTAKLVIKWILSQWWNCALNSLNTAKKH